MPTLREKCISAKVSDEEYAALQARAVGQNLSAWARQVLLADTSPRLTEQVLLGELARVASHPAEPSLHGLQR